MMETPRKPTNIDIIQNKNLISKLHEKLGKRKHYYQPNPEDFRGEPGYSDLDIDKDLKTVEELKEVWKEERREWKQISDVIEGIVADQISSGWLSEMVTGHYTSEADDIIRGVDVVAEITDKDEKHYLGFAMDVTIAESMSALQKKFDHIWDDELQRGRLPEVQYLETDHYKGKIELPKVVIGVSPNFTRELLDLENRNDKEGLAKHAFKDQLIWQIKVQLESYVEYAKIIGNRDLLRKLEKSLKTFTNLVKENNLLKDVDPYSEDSRYYNDIQDFCERKIKDAKRRFEYNES